MSEQKPEQPARISLVLLRKVATELGYQPKDEHLGSLNDQILDRLFQLSPQALTGTDLPKRYRQIAKRVLRKQTP